MLEDDDSVKELLRQVQGGSEIALDRRLEMHRQRLQRTIAVELEPYLRARIDADDIIQNTFRDAFRRIDDFFEQNVLSFFLWLRQIAVNRLKDARRWHRAQRRNVHLEKAGGISHGQSSVDLMNALAGSFTSPSEAFRRNELHQDLEEALAALSSQDQTVLKLRFLERLSLKETAIEMSLPIATVKQRQARAIVKIRKLMADKGHQ